MAETPVPTTSCRLKRRPSRMMPRRRMRCSENLIPGSKRLPKPMKARTCRPSTTAMNTSLIARLIGGHGIRPCVKRATMATAMTR